jgi:hypothetical protein
VSRERAVEPTAHAHRQGAVRQPPDRLRLLRGLTDDPGDPACSGSGGCGRFAPIAARVRGMDGTLVDC